MSRAYLCFPHRGGITPTRDKCIDEAISVIEQPRPRGYGPQAPCATIRPAGVGATDLAAPPFYDE